ncbi:hypothetical protein CORC01_01267 [Colletotrichum orchidophilum]|uniref:Uncharacterized protein n=1 Tax=Colletotrichum orchidophilum TaxID=1209926 RepID=A0A1G4BQE9_9PEZI|nr:uncharacterized protein CORC01_01267 [Colletotrichum orchidophilum]OHF03548.1 hypothetical protein CORC01_01267 [Colletotrichum orchidophilum]
MPRFAWLRLFRRHRFVHPFWALDPEPPIVSGNPPLQNVRWPSAWLLSKRRPAVRPANTCCCTAVAGFILDNVAVVSSSRILNVTRNALQHVVIQDEWRRGCYRKRTFDRQRCYTRPRL